MGTLATSPTINERFILLWLVGEVFFEVARNVRRDMGGSDFFRFERGVLLEDRADFFALGVTKDGQIDGTRDMVNGKLLRRPHVDDFINGRVRCFKMNDPNPEKWH